MGKIKQVVIQSFYIVIYQEFTTFNHLINSYLNLAQYVSHNNRMLVIVMDMKCRMLNVWAILMLFGIMQINTF